MTNEERLANLEVQVAEVKKELAPLRSQGDQLMKLTVLMTEIKERLDQFTSHASGGFNRCAERGILLSNLDSRVNRLEDDSEAVGTLKAEIGAIKNSIEEVKEKVNPMEKKFYMWTGALALLCFAAPFLFDLVR